MIALFLGAIGLFVISPDDEFSEGQVIFSDDFSDPTVTSDQWYVESGHWEIIDDKVTCTAIQHRCLSLASQIDSEQYNIYVVLEGDEGIDKSIYFGISDERAYRISLLADPIHRLTISEIRRRSQLAAVEYKNFPGEVYELFVEIQYDSIAVYINDEQIIYAENIIDDPRGIIGVGIEPIRFRGMKNSASFDYFEIERID